MAALTINWILGVNFNKTWSYQAFVEFPFACGIQVGTQVRVRGVKVGNVLSPNLERVEVLVEGRRRHRHPPPCSSSEPKRVDRRDHHRHHPEIPIPKAQWGR